MPRALALLLGCLAFLPLAVGAITPPSPPVSPVGLNSETGWDRLVPKTPARSDTIWFGGDDGTGTAVEGGVWDWDAIAGDPLQGWISRDVTEDLGDFIYRVTADSFLVHGDPCVPIFPPAPGQTSNIGQIWCGVHEDYADRADFIAGMGYGNESAQRAISPRVPVAAGDDVALSFRYFNDSEPNADYTYVYLNCFDAGGDTLGRYEAARLSGVAGSPTAPATYSGTVPYPSLPAGTAALELEFGFDSDATGSDEDGLFATACGPFGADDVVLGVGAAIHAYDFESDAQGWTFARRPGIGSFMAVRPEGTWGSWVDQAGLSCTCPLEGNVLGFCSENVSYPLPGFPPGHHEYAYSGIVERGEHAPPTYNGAYVRMAGYFHLSQASGSFVRPGWTIYPYTSDVNPIPHWSPRNGQASFKFTGDVPYCAFSRGAAEWDLGRPEDGVPIPPDWERMRFVLETVTDCQRFHIPPSACTDEGEAFGSPLIDRVQIGLTHTPDVPLFTEDTGALFMDGFGQRYPNYLEPSDVGNADITFNLAREDAAKNDWLGDTSCVTGPLVNSEHPRSWIARFCVKVDRKGPRQDMIPGYAAWRQRLAYAGDPEQDFVCVRMDSVQIPQGVYKFRFETYFHESEPGFDPTHPDRTRWQEILPDSLWVPGTRFQYKFEARWVDGTEWYERGPYEFEILPGMRPGPGGEYSIEWPCVIFVDAGNAHGEDSIQPALTGLGLEFDKYDHLGAGCCWGEPMARSFGGGWFNPGGWGNSGCTVNQLIGYRMILWDSGLLATNDLFPEDFDLLNDWLAAADCGLADMRRALILTGDQIGEIMGNPSTPQGPGFMHDVLGATFVATSYREFNDDPSNCVYLVPAPGAVFTPAAPGISLRGNGCPSQYNYNVLGIQPGVPDVVGNLRFHSDQGTSPYVCYAQVVRQKVVPGVANWKTALHGFALQHLARVGCGGSQCSPDSACIVAGVMDLLAPELQWISAGGAPFLPWRYWCEDGGADESETHLSGEVDYLYPVRPNPNRGTAAIRFRLAKPGEAVVRIHDIAGRCVRTLSSGARPAGEQTLVWDGADDHGRRLGTGVYWVRLQTASGYASSLRLLRLE
jgi:hypothetical protein